MFIAVLVNLHLVRGLMIGGCIRLMSVIVITGLQNLGDAVDVSVNLGVNSYVTVNHYRVLQRSIQRSGLLLTLFDLVNWLDPG